MTVATKAIAELENMETDNMTTEIAPERTLRTLVRKFKNLLDKKFNFIEVEDKSLEGAGSLIPEERVACRLSALTFDKNNAIGQYAVGEAYADLGHLDEAIERYEKAIKLNRNMGCMYLRLGDALAKKGQLCKAKECYLEATRLDPNDARGHNNLGVVLARKGEITDSIVYFNRAIEAALMKPNADYADFENLAVTYENLEAAYRTEGMEQEAQECYRKTLEIKRHNDIK